MWGVQSSRDELWALGMHQECFALPCRRDLLRGALPGQFVQKAESKPKGRAKGWLTASSLLRS